jgi:nitrous oxidase accessory protein NosD
MSTSIDAKSIKLFFRNNSKTRHTASVASVLLFTIVGSLILSFTKAAVPTSSLEAENGVSSSCINRLGNDSSASSGSAVKFGCSSSTATPGAKLPIAYDINSLSGTKRFVATTGNDTTGNGTLSSPYATIAKAYSMASANDPIIIRGGTYNESNINITSSSKPVKILAYPNESVPMFSGARSTSGWIAEGSLSYLPNYIPRTVSSVGSGIDFGACQNQTADCLGKYVDQAWVGNTKLKEVGSKGEVVAGKFWVDRTVGVNRMYLAQSDVGKGNVQVSDKYWLFNITVPNVTIEGLQITRYSNTAQDSAVIKIGQAANNNVIRNIEVYDSAFQAIQYGGSSAINTNSILEKATIEGSNWMGVGALYTDNFTIKSSKIGYMNVADEFTRSPQSGALKTSRTWYTKVIDSLINDNNSHGLWFDQSNYKVEVANNTITNNSGTSVFFEISDDLLLINNYIKGGSENIKLAGSSGLKLINNTIVGGKNPIGIYIDSRSTPGCVESKANCHPDSGTYSSDRDTLRVRPKTLDWMPRIDYLINNIVAYPASALYCVQTAMCITLSRTEATTTIQNVIHQASSPYSGMPKTYIDGNVYANGAGAIINTTNAAYYNVQTFGSAMAAAPVSIAGIESNGKTGNSFVNVDGTPTASLITVHSQAVPIPLDGTINQYIPAGTKHYGVLNN